MSDTATRPMTVDEFLVWAEGQPGRHELVDGRIHAMAPERIRHAETKFAAQSALKTAIDRVRLSCHMLPDGATVRIDRSTAFEPDALVYCGPRLPGDAIEIPDPVIVVDVLSPTTSGYNKRGKLAGYFTKPSIQHYLLLDPERRLVVHHRRLGEAIETRFVNAGVLTLDPPGIEVEVEAMMAPE